MAHERRPLHRRCPALSAPDDGYGDDVPTDRLRAPNTSVTESLRTLGRALVRPGRALRDGGIPLQHVVAVVVVVALLNGVGMALAAGAMGDHVDSSMTVDNPDRPSERLCEDPDRYPFEDRRAEIREQCETEPRTVQQPLGPVAQATFTSHAYGLPFLTVAVWLLGSLVVDRLTAVDGSVIDSAFVVVGVAMVPASVRYALRPVLVEQAIAGESFGSSADAVRSTLHGVVSGATSDPILAVAVLTLVWQGYVLVGGLRALRGVSTGRALLVGGLLVIPGVAHLQGVGAVGAVGPPAGLLVLGGLVVAAYPRRIAEFELHWDAIGARNRGDLEAADWYVTLHRYSGLAGAVLGLVLVGGLAYVL